MYGTGLAKGLLLTLRHFVDSYVDDIRYGFRKYHHSTDNFGVRQGTKTKGVITVQYPDEKVAVPERFRFVPFLIVEDEDHPTRSRQGLVHELRHLRQGLPAAVHLDRARQRPQYRAPRARA